MMLAFTSACPTHTSEPRTFSAELEYPEFGFSALQSAVRGWTLARPRSLGITARCPTPQHAFLHACQTTCGVGQACAVPPRRAARTNGHSFRHAVLLPSRSANPFVAS